MKMPLNKFNKSSIRKGLVATTPTNSWLGIAHKKWCCRISQSSRECNHRSLSFRPFSCKTTSFILMTYLYAALSHSQVQATHEHLCLGDDYTNDLPIFIEKRTICNYDTTPVHVYSIKIMPDKINDYKPKFCLTGEFAETFNITKENELKLFGRLEQTETNLKLQIIKTANDIVGTPGERRKAVNAIQFILSIEDCNQVSWQTIVVAILSSVCVALMSSLAIMLILYQQKGLIRTGNGDAEERGDEINYTSDFRQDESFINPRRTSSYEFNTLPKHSEGITLARIESEKL